MLPLDQARFAAFEFALSPKTFPSVGDLILQISVASAAAIRRVMQVDQVDWQNDECTCIVEWSPIRISQVPTTLRPKNATKKQRGLPDLLRVSQANAFRLVRSVIQQNPSEKWLLRWLEDAMKRTPFDPAFVAPEGERTEHVKAETSKRSRKASRQKLYAAFATKKLTCEGCGFDCQKFYKIDPLSFYQVHHKTLLSDGNVRDTRQSDLAILCPNCHVTIHSIEPMTIAALKSRLKRLTRKRSSQ
jgi:hypothetical protein